MSFFGFCNEIIQFSFVSYLLFVSFVVPLVFIFESFGRLEYADLLRKARLDGLSLFFYPEQKKIRIPLPFGSRDGSAPNFRKDVSKRDSVYVKELDVAIIGGGVHGAVVAKNLARKGLSVLLVDKGDFSSGTSQNSAKLLHSGLKYFKDFVTRRDLNQFRMVMMGMEGRAFVSRAAPHLSEPVGFIVLDQEGNEILKYRLALSAYDFLGRVKGGKSIPWNRRLYNSEIREQCTPMTEEITCDGVRYFEYSLDDSRYVLANVKDAVRHGAYARNYTEVVGLEKLEDDDGYLVTVKDVKSTEEQPTTTYKSKFVVNASGANVFDVAEMLKVKTSTDRAEEVIKYKGCFIVVRRNIGKDIIVFHVKKENWKKKKVIYMIPFGPKKDLAMIGTTDTFFFALPKFVGMARQGLARGEVEGLMKEEEGKSFFVSRSEEEESEGEDVEKDEERLYDLVSLQLRKGEMNYVVFLCSDDDPSELFNDISVSGMHVVRAPGSMKLVEDTSTNETSFTPIKEEECYLYEIPMKDDHEKHIKIKSNLLLENDCYESKPSFKDITYLVDCSNTFFSSDTHISSEDVISSFCGIRSYKKSKKKADSEKISRMHEIETSKDGRLVHVYGGKLTTSHLLAKEVEKIVLKEISSSSDTDSSVTSSSDNNDCVCGGFISDPTEFVNEFYGQDHKIFGDWLDRGLYEHLVMFYGSEYQRVLEVIQRNPEKYTRKIYSSVCPHVIGEIVFQVEDGFVLCPQDFVRRRTSLSLNFGGEEGREIESVVEDIVLEVQKRE